jgi:hypothetical protein
MDEFWTHYVLDEQTGNFSPASQLKFLNRFSESEGSEPTVLVDQERLYLWKNEEVDATTATQTIYSCSLDDLNLAYAEIEKVLLSNHFSFDFHAHASQLLVMNNVAVVGSSFKLAFVDLREKCVISMFRARQSINNVRWIDETLLCLEQDNGIHLLDFTGRSSDWQLSSPTPPKLPCAKQNLALLEVDTSGQKSIRLVEVAAGTLHKVMQVCFGENWSGTSLMVKQSNRIAHGSDKAIRSTTYVWFRSDKSTGQTAEESAEFVRSWDELSLTTSEFPKFSWMLEFDLSSPDPPTRNPFISRKKKAETPVVQLPPLEWTPNGHITAIAFMSSRVAAAKGLSECLFYSMSELEAQAAFSRLP